MSDQNHPQKGVDGQPGKPLLRDGQLVFPDIVMKGTDKRGGLNKEEQQIRSFYTQPAPYKKIKHPDSQECRTARIRQAHLQHVPDSITPVQAVAILDPDGGCRVVSVV
ncbi:hypothetical protein [Pseudomonas syringae]|uniref:hypothetical protein n=1 Tax=Pseudomonas syringae TaxID=317 RepID=UPI0012AEB395|nr:hypothetical protein [Pseudomonas syringae]